MSDVEVEIEVDAPPARVWELVGDPSRMGEWSPECRRVTWKPGSSGPALGARFRGHNRKGWRRWSTTGTITVYEPGRQIAWRVTALGQPVADWGYRVTEAPDGRSRLTETFSDKRSPLLQLGGKPARGVSDTNAHNRVGMEQTLVRIKDAAEGRARAG